MFYYFQPSFAVSVDSSTLKSVNSTTKERRAAIPGIGTATQLPNGEVNVRYPDGTQLWVDGKHQVKFQYAGGQIVSFSDTDNIPRQIVAKLQHMPKVLKYLLPNSVPHKTRSLR